MIQLSNPINAFIISKTHHLGLPDDILFFAIVLLSSYLFNFIYLLLFKTLNIGSKTSRPLLKQLYIISVGLFFIVGVLNSISGLAILLTNSFIVYFLCRLNYKKKNNGLLPWYILIGLLIFVLIAHINTTLIENGAIITGCLMVLVIKLHEFTWNCQDVTEIDHDNELNTYQKDKIITKFPTLLEFLSYVLFYNTLFTGPAFEYQVYIKWLKSDNEHSKTTNPALFKFGKGIFFLIAFFKMAEWFPVGQLLDNDYSLLKKFFLLYLIGMIFRFKYYGAWSIAESLCNMVQLGYNDKTNDYYLIKNVNVRGFEFAQNTKGALESWNESTNIWLKNYIYLRFIKLNKNPTLASLITFTVSATWHGIHAGYYLTFVTGSLYQTAGKIIRRFIRPHFLGSQNALFKIVYDIITMIITQTAFGYLVLPFIVLNLKDSFTIWKSVYFIPHLSILVLVLIKPFLKKTAPKTETKTGVLNSSLKDILEDKYTFEKNEKKKTLKKD